MILERKRIVALFLLTIYYANFCGVIYASTHNVPRYSEIIKLDSTSSNIESGFTYNNYEYANGKISLTNATKKNKFSSAIDLNRTNLAIKKTGPTQPEMLTFQSVNTDNMVNLFTGDFSYSIPLMDVGGYPINLFYKAGVGLEDEASWVGLGWNLNPGSITRTMRGLPDDFDGSEAIVKTQSIKPDITVGINYSSKEKEFGGMGEISNSSAFTYGVFYNNKTGLGYEIGKNFNLTKIWNKATDTKTFDSAFLKLNLGLNLNSKTGLSVDPNISLKITKNEKSIFSNIQLGTSYNSRTGVNELQLSAPLSKGFGRKFTEYKVSEYSSNFYTRNYTHLSHSLSIPFSFSSPSYTPSITMPITHNTFKLKFKWGNKEKGPRIRYSTIDGYLVESKILDKDKITSKRAYGFMYMDKGEQDPDGLLDFNRLNDKPFTKQSLNIAAPQYTFDVFNISGEGTGGSFRAYRSNIGYTKDPINTTKSNTGGLGIEIMPGKVTSELSKYVQLGIDLSAQFVGNKITKWSSDKSNIERELDFQGTKADVEGFYFKNPAEKAIIPMDYYKAVGGDNLMRVQLINPTQSIGTQIFGVNSPSAVNNFEVFDDAKSIIKKINFTKQTTTKIRDKRTQVITCLRADEANKVGFDKDIYSYELNKFNSCTDVIKLNRCTEGKLQTSNYRKSNHISEINVLEQDGKRYVYGIPVYNTKHIEATVGVGYQNVDSKQISTYEGSINGELNPNDNEKTINKEEIPPYTHSYLLTSLLSSDYVDVTNDGITDDDLGTAVKFNYSRMGYQGNNTWQNLKWRTPNNIKDPITNSTLNTGIYLEGLKTDKTDDKVSVMYGEREQWYTNSIESKTMVALFTLEDRQDNKVSDIDGNTESCGLLKRLKKIELFAKTELHKKGGKAKPIKTVVFEYGYTLCKGSPQSSKSNLGKLTLLGLSFYYNGVDLGTNNSSYKFAYDENPDYERNAMDRWGNFKPISANPSYNKDGISQVSLTNSYFPFTPQPSLNAPSNISRSDLDRYAASWNLSRILLPSGSEISVKYESDDYGYVQNKRATQMLKIRGMGESKNPQILNVLGQTIDQSKTNRLGSYDLILPQKTGDYEYVYLDVPQSLNLNNNVDKLKKIFFEDLDQLAFKMAVKMPSDQKSGNEHYEDILSFANIWQDENGNSDIGFAANIPNVIYVKIEKNKDGSSPMMATIVQFLQENLSSKAFPNSDVGDKDGLSQIFSSLIGMMSRVSTAFSNFEHTARRNGLCTNFDPERSFVRVDNPYFSKIGGGYRVKEVRIKDNWSRITSGSATSSEYGQVYDYSTTEMINNVKTKITSGVATYEPSIGAEENPFKVRMAFSQSKFLGPTSYGFTETPLLDALYPAPMIGYSKVTVSSIHNNQNGLKVKNPVGFSESQFYTSKDFPTYCDYTNFDGNSKSRFAPNPILRFLNIYWVEGMTMSQGFRIVLNDMNGKPKSQASYPENEPTKPLSYTEYNYNVKKTGLNSYELLNKVLVADKTGQITTKEIGKDVEVMVDMRQHTNENFGFSAELNLILQGVPPVPPAVLPAFIGFGIPHYSKNTYRDVSLTKVVNNYGVLESIKSIDKGSEVSNKNILYDAETGDVLLNETQNEFNKPIYTFKYPAQWAYPEMGGAYKNIDVVFDNCVFKNGILQNENGEINESLFQSGDEIYVNNDQIKEDIFKNTIGCWGLRNTNTLCGDNAKYLTNTRGVFKIWALDMSKGFDANKPSSNQKQLVFIDINGKPFNSSGTKIRIIRSGYKNYLNAVVSSTTSLLNPITFTNIENTEGYIDINKDKKIINSNAVEYKEKWKTEDAFFVKVQREYRDFYAPLSGGAGTYFPAVKTISYQNDRGGKKDNKWILGNFTLYEDPLMQSSIMDLKHFNTTHKDYGKKGGDYTTASFALFDFGSLKGKTIYSAKLELFTHGYGLMNMPVHSYYGSESGVGRNHNEKNPHYFEAYWQKITVDRVKYKAAWDDISFNTWRDVINGSNYSNYNKRIAESQDFKNDNNYDNKASLCSNCGVGGGDNSIKINDIVEFQKMIDENGNNSNNASARNYPTAIKIYQEHQNEDHVSFCFSSGLSVSPEGPGPRFIISYFDKNQGSMTPPSSGIEGVDYAHYKDSVDITYCLSIFDSNYINPYQHGLIGQWRNNISYVFNGNREQKNPLQETDIEKNGVIDNFYPYWNWIDDKLQAAVPKLEDQAGWVWNSQVTQYNGKGLEVENFDALYRFNAGTYGYNNTLPTSVVNNARYREIAFDGFEDYGYEENDCPKICKQTEEDAKRHFLVFDENNRNNATITQSEKHTGKSSLLIPPNGSFSLKSIRVKKDVNSNAEYTSKYFEPKLEMDVCDENYNGLTIHPNGTGMNGHFAGQIKNGSGCGFDYTGPPYINYQGDWTKAIPVATCSPFEWNHFDLLNFSGMILLPEDGDYEFGFSNVNNEGNYVISGTDKNNNLQTIAGRSDYQSDGSRLVKNTTAYLENVKKITNFKAGSLVNIVINFWQRDGISKLKLVWKRPGDPFFTDIPDKNFYPNNSVLNSNVITQEAMHCLKPTKIKALDDFKIDAFTLQPSKKMVLSFWAKQAQDDCKLEVYNDINVTLSGEGISGNSMVLMPSGNIIEGWQRFEYVFTTSSNEAPFTIRLNAGVYKTYFDDIRIHPYNSNMKSFVYDPVTLRLTSDLDENNYASFYEYDNEGTLIRVKKETKEGVKTIKETRSSIQKNIKNLP